MYYQQALVHVHVCIINKRLYMYVLSTSACIYHVHRQIPLDITDIIVNDLLSTAWDAMARCSGPGRLTTMPHGRPIVGQYWVLDIHVHYMD